MSKSKEELPLPFSSRKYSCKFVVRVQPEVYCHLAIEVAETGVTLNLIPSGKTCTLMKWLVIGSEKRKIFSKEK